MGQDKGPIIRKGKARTVTIQTDNLFKRSWGAKYEEGMTRTRAINAAVRCLTDKDKTVADLAVTDGKVSWK